MPGKRTRPRAVEDEGAAGDADDEESAWIGDMDRLQLDEEGSLVFFGPSSARTFGSLSADQPLSSPPLQLGAPSTGGTYFDYSRYLPRELGLTREMHDSVLQLFEAFFASWCRVRLSSSSRIVAELIGLAFTLQVVDMYSFRADMAICLAPGGPTRTQNYSPMLHNACLAVGLRLWQGDQVQPFPELVVVKNGALEACDAERASAVCYHHARSFVEDEAERPMLSTIRGLLLVAS